MQPVKAVFQWTPSPAARWFIRGAAAFATLYAGIYFVGRHYPHLCRAGSPMIEWIGMFGVPLLAAAAVGFIRRYRVGLVVAVLLLTTAHAAREPYHRWVHGPNSPWPASRWTSPESARRAQAPLDPPQRPLAPD
jgi:hypothetical protein